MAIEELPVFSISPNPSALYLTRPLMEGLARIKRAIQRKQGLAMLLGGVGLGKSSLLRLIALDYQVNEERYTVSYIHDSRRFKTPFDFLRHIGSDFQIDPKRSQNKQIAAIEDFLFKNYEEQKTTLVFVDEAQRLSLDILEHIRSLLNFETNTHKLIQFVLAGQTELQDKLLERRYKMVRDRIVATLLLKHFTLEETRLMIAKRLESWGIEDPFAAEAIEEIYQRSEGSPRRTLLLCQQACDLTEKGELVTSQHVVQAYELMQIKESEEGPVDSA